MEKFFSLFFKIIRLDLILHPPIFFIVSFLSFPRNFHLPCLGLTCSGEEWLVCNSPGGQQITGKKHKFYLLVYQYRYSPYLKDCYNSFLPWLFSPLDLLPSTELSLVNICHMHKCFFNKFWVSNSLSLSLCLFFCLSLAYPHLLFHSMVLLLFSSPHSFFWSFCSPPISLVLSLSLSISFCPLFLCASSHFSLSIFLSLLLSLSQPSPFLCPLVFL